MCICAFSSLSRSPMGWCECCARVFNPWCCRCSTPGRISPLAAPELLRVSGIITPGTECSPLRSGRKNLLAALVDNTAWQDVVEQHSAQNIRVPLLTRYQALHEKRPLIGLQGDDKQEKSGRPGSNRRQPAWKAGTPFMTASMISIGLSSQSTHFDESIRSKNIGCFNDCLPLPSPMLELFEKPDEICHKMNSLMLELFFSNTSFPKRFKSSLTIYFVRISFFMCNICRKTPKAVLRYHDSATIPDLLRTCKRNILPQSSSLTTSPICPIFPLIYSILMKQNGSRTDINQGIATSIFSLR